MYIKNRVASLAFKCVIIITAAIGIYLNSGLPNGRLAPSMFLYYTIQSNLLCLLYFSASAVAIVRLIKKGGIHGESTFAIHLKGAVILAITVTLLIYWFVLVGAEFSMIEGSSDMANLTVHLFVPVLSLLDWVLFDAKGQFHKLDPLKWLIIPLCYYAFTVVAAQFGATYYDGGRYPYFFINPDILGKGQVAINVLGLAAAFLAIGFIVLALDKAFSKFGKVKAKQ